MVNQISSPNQPTNYREMFTRPKPGANDGSFDATLKSSTPGQKSGKVSDHDQDDAKGQTNITNRDGSHIPNVRRSGGEPNDVDRHGRDGSKPHSKDLDRAFGPGNSKNQSGSASGNLMADAKQLSADFKKNDMTAVAKDIMKLLTDVMSGSGKPNAPVQKAMQSGGSAPMDSTPGGSAPTDSTSGGSSPMDSAPGGNAPVDSVPSGGLKNEATPANGTQQLVSLLEKLLADMKSGNQNAANTDVQQLVSALSGRTTSPGGAAPSSGNAPAGRTSPSDGTTPPGGAAPSSGSAPAGGTPSSDGTTPPGGAAPSSGSAPAGGMQNLIGLLEQLLKDLKSGDQKAANTDVQQLLSALGGGTMPPGGTASADSTPPSDGTAPPSAETPSDDATPPGGIMPANATTPGGATPPGVMTPASATTPSTGTTPQPGTEATVKAIASLVEDVKTNNTQNLQKDVEALAAALQKPQPSMT